MLPPLSFSKLQQEWQYWLSPRVLFLAATTLFVVVVTLLWYLRVLPFSVEYFAFYSVLLFVFALWRPTLAFLLVIGCLPLEIVSVTPAEWGFGLRPYQWTAALLGLALAVQLATGRLRWPLFAWNRFDSILFVFGASTLASGLINGGLAPKQSVVVVSFVYLYFLARVFFKHWNDVGQGLLFFAVPSALMLGWGVVQNILFLRGQDSSAVMPGRPNGTLPEPDWLGLYILFLLAPLLWLLARRIRAGDPVRSLIWPGIGLSFLLLVLLLTVSRSAWLGAGVLVAVFGGVAFAERGTFLFRESLLFTKITIVAGALALGLSQGIPLTRFVLFDRAESTLSHFQTITIACPTERPLPERISFMDELQELGCEHILLEEREMRQRSGEWVATLERPDPNVGIRKELYAKTWAALREAPLLGVGWGNIGARLGTDERGASYNTSNIFLETWAGGGVLALFALIAFFGCAGHVAIVAWRNGVDVISLAALVALTLGMLVFNLFNAGLLLGFLFVFLACWPILRELALRHQSHS